VSRSKRQKVATGIYRDAAGFSVVARVGSGVTALSSKEARFPLDTALSVMEAHWHREKMKLKDAQGGPIVRGTLAADIVAYLLRAKLTPRRRKEREQQLAWWRERFGTRSRASLDAKEIAAALDGLRKAASTVNKYRTALSNLYTVLDGRNALNPFRDIKREEETSATIRRDQPYEIIDAILAHVRARGRGDTLSRTRAFLLVEAYAPVTRAQLVKMTPGDVNFETGEIRPPGRAKGQGTAPIAKPICGADAIAAFRAFDAAGCWGVQPSRSSIWRTFTRARDAAIKELRRTKPHLDLTRAATMRPYDLRHSFAVFTRPHTSLDITGRLLDHRDASTTSRYVQGAVDPLLVEAGRKIAAAFAARPKYTPPPVPVPRTRSTHQTATSGIARKKAERRDGSTRATSRVRAGEKG
jgi:site-specific recombinase XerD